VIAITKDKVCDSQGPSMNRWRNVRAGPHSIKAQGSSAPSERKAGQATWAGSSYRNVNCPADRSGLFDPGRIL